MVMRMKRRKHPMQSEDGMVLLIMLFYFIGFGMLALRDLRWQGAVLMILVPMGIWVGTKGIASIFPADRLILALINDLCAMGILVLFDTHPSLAYRQAFYYGIGILGMLGCMYMVRTIPYFGRGILPVAVCSLVLLALPLVVGRETNGARNWIYWHSISFQPSEIGKVLLLIVLSECMYRQRKVAGIVFAMACLALLMLQKDLGTGLLYYGVTLLLFYAASGSLLLTGIGCMGGAGAAYLGYRMFAHVKKRVAIWKNPWADYDNSGYQIIQGLMALASGRWLGMGLGLGAPTRIPVYETDFIFAVICEQFGLIVGICVLLKYLALIWRGGEIAVQARDSFHALLCLGATAMIGLQTFVIIGGVITLIPLTGVTLPFISSGGSSLLSSMMLMGLMQGVASLNADAQREEEAVMLRQ